MHLILIGYRGTGKTTVAGLLASQLQRPCWDADKEIERRAGKSIQQIFADQGEAVFRDYEQRVLAELIDHPPGILALGGGAILREPNRQALRGGVVIWLTAEPSTILARVAADPASGSQRPNLTTGGGLQEIESILAKRAPLYRGCADYIVSTENKTADQVAAEIVCLVNDSTSPSRGCS